MKDIEKILVEMNDAFKTLKASGASKAEIKELELKISEISKGDSANIEKLTKIIKDQGEHIVEFKSWLDDQNGKVKTQWDKLEKFVIDNKNVIKDIGRSGSGSIEIELGEEITKAVGVVSTGSGTSTGNILADQISNINLRSADLVNFITIDSTSKASFSYAEASPKDGDVDFVAEGGTKSQLDFQWENTYPTPKKAAGYEVITEEARDDVNGLMSVARNFLRAKHDIKVMKGIFTGSGTGANPEGLFNIGRSFNAGSMASSVPDPTLIDVIFACATDIRTTHNFPDEEPFLATLALVNPVDFYLGITAAKDNEGRPLHNVGININSIVIGGMVIVADEIVPAGDLFVGDLTKYHKTNYKPYTIRIGWHDDDFIKNQFVMLGESRFFTWIKSLDRTALVYDQIATVKAAIKAV